MENSANSNNINLHDSWSLTKSKLKQKFAVLTDSDVLFENDKKDQLLTRIQKKLGKTKEELEKIISEL